MIFRSKRIATTLVFTITSVFFMTGCGDTQPNQPTTTNSNSNQVAVNTQQPPTVTNTQPSNTTQAPADQAVSSPVTMPVLDAMFAEANFPADLKSKLNLTDEQIEKLKQAAREATANLKETNAGSTTQARQQADEQIKAIIGADKASELAKFVAERWNGGNTPTVATQQPNAIPTDTRIVVNAPAYRMDLYRDGKLVRTYKIGIGYPEFPLPTGMRKASEIIFNPTWTPPDEPWVKGKVKAGQKVPAGSALNPLGPLKIPIGSPSLIHGGKNPARLGTFASHGCVGLTNPQVQDFAIDLAQISDTQLTTQDVANYEKKKTETKNVKLGQTIQVELRYETIVVENGVLKIYRDVYEHGTNTEANLRKVLDAYGVSFNSLSQEDRAKIMDGLKKMALDPAGNPVQVAKSNTNTKNKNSNQSGSVTRTIKGEKEVAIPLAALQGKGYPVPVNLNTGVRSNKPANSAVTTTSPPKPVQSNSNQSSQQKEIQMSKKP